MLTHTGTAHTSCNPTIPFTTACSRSLILSDMPNSTTPPSPQISLFSSQARHSCPDVSAPTTRYIEYIYRFRSFSSAPRGDFRNFSASFEADCALWQQLFISDRIPALITSGTTTVGCPEGSCRRQLPLQVRILFLYLSRLVLAIKQQTENVQGHVHQKDQKANESGCD